MKEFQKIVEAYDNLDFKERKAALATVVKIQGSSYRRPGARMLMTDDGRWVGAISGGCLEGDALRRSREVILEGKPRVVTYDTTDDESAQSLGVGLGCNGIIDVIIEPIDESSSSNPIDLLKTFLTNRASAALATIYNIEGEFQAAVGQRMMRKAKQEVQNMIQDPILAELIEKDLVKIQNTGQSLSKVYHTERGRAEVFLEAMNPALHLIVFGGGYDAVPVTKLAREIGWQVTVTDDCIAHLSPKRFPDADDIVPIDRHEVAQKLAIDAYTAALLISHNYTYDLAVLESLLDTDLRYIGILGPQKRAVKMFNALKEKGKLKASDYQRIHGPVGLNIGAETPDEIALSIIAEIQAKFSGRPGNFLKDLEGPIHDEYPFFKPD